MKFLVDAMLGKLSRLLRIYGFDTIYAEDVEPSAPDSMLLEYAIKNDRIIITRDLPFHRISQNNSIYCNQTDAYENLLALGKELNLEFDFSIENARCSACNSPLEKINDKNSIKEQVKPETFHNFKEFYRCTNLKCNKIYWKGSHIDKIIEKLKK